VSHPLLIRLKGNVAVVVPDDLKLITPFVLLEQEDWFEYELAFMRHVFEPGMTVADIGANYGMYTLAAARAVGPTGTVVAYEPTPDVASALTRSIHENGFTNIRLQQMALSDAPGQGAFSVTVDSELNRLGNTPPAHGSAVTVAVDTLDLQWRSLGLPPPDFVKIDVEGHGVQVFRGARGTLESADPLVMFEIDLIGEAFDRGLLSALEESGYRMFYLLPSAAYLVPFDAQAPTDPLALNVFAAKPGRVDALARRGLLADPAYVTSGPSTPWSAFVTRAPYAAAMTATWSRGPRLWAKSGDKAYHAALDGFAQSQPVAGRSAWARFAALTSARRYALEALTASSSLGRTLTAARLEQESGNRMAAVSLLKPLAPAVMSGEFALPQEPFLPPLAQYDQVAWDGQDREWITSAVLEALVKLSNYSDYYSRGASDPWLVRLATSPYASAEMARRRQLRRLALGLPLDPRDRETLATSTGDNLNAGLWNSRFA
jgi:protein O-GlcNAc transferase